MCVECPEQASPQRQEVDSWLGGAGEWLLMGMGLILGEIKMLWH